MMQEIRHSPPERELAALLVPQNSGRKVGQGKKAGEDARAREIWHAFWPESRGQFRITTASHLDAELFHDRILTAFNA